MDVVAGAVSIVVALVAGWVLGFLSGWTAALYTAALGGPAVIRRLLHR